MNLTEVFLFLSIVVGLLLWVNSWKTTKTFYTFPSEIDPTFKSQVSDILATSNWKKYVKYDEVQSEDSADILVELAHRDSLDDFHTVPEYYPDGKQIRFSITKYGKGCKPHIYIDHLSWLNGNEPSKLTLNEYRQYVTNHEFGHGLGFDHQPCTTSRCPVMYQSTRGCPAGTKCGFVPIDIDTTKQLISKN